MASCLVTKKLPDLSSTLLRKSPDALEEGEYMVTPLSKEVTKITGFFCLQ